MVHRDVKLENILIDGDGNMKLIDFGLCGYFVQGKRLRCHCGSPSYVSLPFPSLASLFDRVGGSVAACGTCRCCVAACSHCSGDCIELQREVGPASGLSLQHCKRLRTAQQKG